MREIRPNAEHGNYTSIHNAYFDELMPRLTPAEWKVLCVILRKTRGWTDGNGGRKQEDAISYSQIEKSAGIGSRHTVKRALDTLEKEGVITVARRNRRQTSIVRLNRDYVMYVEDDEQRSADSAPLEEVVHSVHHPSALSALTNGRTSALSAHTKESLNKVQRKNTPSSLLTEDFPKALDTPSFREQWEKWERHLKENGKKLTRSTRRAQLSAAAEHGAEAAALLIRESIEKGWKALYWERLEQKKSSDSNRDAMRARVDAYRTRRLLWADCTPEEQAFMRHMTRPGAPEDLGRLPAFAGEKFDFAFYKTCKELGI